MSAIRDLHSLAFGHEVAAWYDEACEIWRHGYGQEGDPPVLLFDRGGYAGYGRALADAGPHRLEGTLTKYLIRLFANDQTRQFVYTDQDLRDLIAHELGHVYECVTTGRWLSEHRSTHDRPSWREACAIATPFMLPEFADIAAEHGVTLTEVFMRKASRVVWDRETKGSVRVPQAGGLGPDLLSHWPFVFRKPSGRAAFIEACEAAAITSEQQSKDCAL